MANFRQPTLIAKISLLLAVVFSYSIASYSQSLYSLTDSVKIFSWLTKADVLTEISSFDSAKHYTSLALNISREKKMLRGQAYAHLKIADTAYRKAETDSLIYHDSIALKIAAQLKDSFLVALANYQLGQYYLEDEKYDEAHKFFTKALLIKFSKEKSN